MSTRGIILITGKNLYGQDRTCRLYKHCGSYPSGNLPLIAKTLEEALRQCRWENDRYQESKYQPNVDQVVGLLIGAATDVHGMSARLDDDDGKPAVYSEPFTPSHAGSQWDLEWLYLVNLEAKTVNVYGGGYQDCSPQQHFKNGLADPSTYANQLKEQFQSQEREEIANAVKAVEALGFAVNKTTKPHGGRSRKSKSKSNVVPFERAKTNALVTIVYDDVKGKLRAEHDGSWVRFPNDLRVQGACYQVETLKRGKGGSWIACGRIEPVRCAA